MHRQTKATAIPTAVKAAVAERDFNPKDGNGYYQTSDLDEIAAQYWSDTSYAMSILSRRKHMRNVLKAAGRTV